MQTNHGLPLLAIYLTTPAGHRPPIHLIFLCQLSAHTHIYEAYVYL